MTPASHRLFHLLLAAMLFQALTLLAAEARGQSAAGPACREDVSLNAGWEFARADVAGAETAGAHDSPWQKVDLPHTWNNLDGQDGGDDYYRGPAWYRRHIAVGPAWAGKSMFLKFEGANRMTDVFLNGRKIGAHVGGFGAFCFDVSDALVPGENLLAVRVSNAHNDDSPPLAADFTFFGGLYRGVHLLVLDKLSISPLDFASPGVYVRQAKVSPQEAELEITVKLRNARGAGQTAVVRTSVVDAAGKIVRTAETKHALAARSAADCLQRIVIDQPHLWNGLKDPYLYRVTVELGDGHAVTDRVRVPLGLRFFRVDPNLGFFLNGQPYHLHGVCRHQDRLDKGWAIGPAEHKQDFELIRAMGCTAIRLAHYQHAQEFYDLCDAGGMVAWAEIPLVNKITHNQAFTDNARQQLTELIKQNYNHPSICFWSIFNELAIGGKETAKGNLPEELAGLVRQLDPTRLSAAANCSDPDHRFNFYTDVIGFNLYFGWYAKNLQGLGPHLDAVHKKHPRWNIALTEYGAGASIFQHEFDPPTPKTPVCTWHPEEYQAKLHEASWKALKDRPYVWGTFIWNMFDFAVDNRKEGDHAGRNDKGLVTYDRKVCKDAFYFYQANWTTAPMVHITSSRFTPRKAGNTTVKVYSNCPQVELKLNGKSLGGRAGKECVFLWENVPLALIENKLEAVAERDGKSVSDSCQWTGVEKDPATRKTEPATAMGKAKKNGGS